MPGATRTAAEAELDRLALLRGWMVAGPFDNEGKRGFDHPFPPEEGEGDLAARWPGKVREVGWRPLPPEAEVQGFVNLGLALRPARDVTAYALAVVESPREQRVRLHVGSSGAVKVFVNGALALADPSYHPPRLDQVAAELTLRKGANRLLVKVSQAEGRFGFFARLARPGGEPLELARQALPPLPPRPAPGALDAAPVPGVIEALERRAREAAGKEAAAAYRDLAIALAERQPGEERERQAAAAARQAVLLDPRHLGSRLLAARLEDDANRRSAHLEAAVEAHPGDATALGMLAQMEAQRGRLARARSLLDRALAAAPGAVAPRLLLAEVEEAAGLEAQAAARRAATAASAPDHPGAALAAARSARGQGHLDEAERLLRRALALRHDDGAARALLVQLQLDRGDLDGAVAGLQEALRVDPSDGGARLRLAELQAANGRADAAEASFADLLRIAPEEAEVLERRGKARMRAGLSSGALADFHAALELRPQNPQLKELVRAMAPGRERFETPYLLDARALAREAPPAPGGGRGGAGRPAR